MAAKNVNPWQYPTSVSYTAYALVKWNKLSCPTPPASLKKSWAGKVRWMSRWIVPPQSQSYKKIKTSILIN